MVVSVYTYLCKSSRTFGETLLILLITFIVSNIQAQTYFLTGSINNFKSNSDMSSCSCSFEWISPSYGTTGITLTPDTILVENGNGYLWEIDTITGVETTIFTPPPLPPPEYWHLRSLVSVGGGVYYGMTFPESELYRLNTNSGSFTYMGTSGIDLVGDLALFDGNIYYSTYGGIVLLDTSNLNNNSIVVTFPINYVIGGLTASPFCNTLLGIGAYINSFEAEIVLINLIDGTISTVCQLPEWSIDFITSIREFTPPSVCEITLDLDCNDSSGATGADYNSSPVTCLMRQAPVADEDVRMFYDDWIEEMTIRVTGSVPDGLDEWIDMTGTVPGIDISGQGTDLLTLSNAGGAKSSDFIDALHLVRYVNSALSPTAGLRTIEVQFSTASGSMSNVGVAYVEVNAVPALVVDIGPDQLICEGSSAFFDAGSFPGGVYQWSSGQMTQTITAVNDGTYIVTVSDATHCPGTDTAEVVTIPLISIALTGDVVICDNQSATLTLNTNAPFPVTVEIQADPGSPFVFDDVVGNYSFTDLPQQNTTYTITSVTPSQEACIEITDSVQIIDVYPTYQQMVDVSICDGDSVWLGFYWETEAGMYENTFNTIYGCDSIVTTTITILPAVMLQVQKDTCDASAVGVFVTTIDNPNGCDTVVTTTISLLPTDTTVITQSTCVWSDAGVYLDTLINRAGCDSLVIHHTIYIPPGDTTVLPVMTCDSSLLGVFYDTLSAASGCDSIVVRNVTYILTDTTYQSGTSCIPGQIGVFETWYADAQGCDSLVITTVTMGVGDTTMVHRTSCDSTQIGVSQHITTGVDGCDSLVITTITYSAQDSTFLSSSTCDPAGAGVFVTQWTNQFGCDSIVTETITLLPSDTTSESSTTCDPSMAGVFVNTLSNQYGCDSIVTETVVLLPNDAIVLSSTTCVASEAGVFVSTLTNQYGCDSIITETITLLPGDTTHYQQFTCDPAQTGSMETLYMTQDGCDSLVIETTSLLPPPQVTLESIVDYNGYDVSCTGDADGGVMAVVSGISPYTYLWSTNATDQQITGVAAGDYAVTITDGNGCSASEVITLTEPSGLMMRFEVTEPDCFDQALGIIRVEASGGVPPYRFAKDGGVSQTSDLFDSLGDGIYLFTVTDANGCTREDLIAIDAPLQITVDLGSDQNISLGDTTEIQAIVNLPLDSISAIGWTGIDSSGCENCLYQIVAPVITTAYSITVSSVDGCSDRDTMTVSVTSDQHLYIPNIFSPNGDGINDVLKWDANNGVKEIALMEIFDRWGNHVFGFSHKTDDDVAGRWDGTFKGERLNPGVFTYRAVVAYVTGKTEVKYGDITLVR